MIKDLNFIDFLMISSIIELIMLYLFRFTRSPFTGIAINNWYTNLRWTAIIFDILSLMIGFYISRFIYLFLLNHKYISNEYPFSKFLGIVLMVQIIHDFSFYFLTKTF